MGQAFRAKRLPIFIGLLTFSDSRRSRLVAHEHLKGLPSSSAALIVDCQPQVDGAPRLLGRFEVRAPIAEPAHVAIADELRVHVEAARIRVEVRPHHFATTFG